MTTTNSIQGESFFFASIREGNQEAVELFLEMGVDPNVKSNITKESALYTAVYEKQYEIVKLLLLKYGAYDKRLYGECLDNILMCAARKGYYKIVRLIVKSDRFHQHTDDYSIHYSIFIAAKNIEKTDNFVKKGAYKRIIIFLVKYYDLHAALIHDFNLPKKHRFSREIVRLPSWCDDKPKTTLKILQICYQEQYLDILLGLINKNKLPALPILVIIEIFRNTLEKEEQKFMPTNVWMWKVGKTAQNIVMRKQEANII